MIFKVDDEAELSEKLKYVIENYSSLSGAVQNFRNKVKELFNLEKMIEKHIELYKECLS